MFVTFFDEKYAKWAELLLRSLAVFHPNVPVIVVGVDLSADTALRVCSNHLQSKLVHRTVHESGECRGTVIANSRPLWLYEIVSQFDFDWCCLLDADLLIRAPLNDIIAALRCHDAAVVIRSGLLHGRIRKHLQAAAGLVWFGRSGIALLECWCEKLQRANPVKEISPGSWFWEQICLVDALGTQNLRTYCIDQSRYLSSPPFSEAAAIWSANVKAPEKEEALVSFRIEMERICAANIHSILERREIP